MSARNGGMRSWMTGVLGMAIWTILANESFAQQTRAEEAAEVAKRPAINAKGEPATHANVAYGPHERNKLDIWLAKSNQPTPLVIFIHGGGFQRGDKSSIYPSDDVTDFLGRGISFATINYRFMDTDPRGVRACFADCARALQFIRSKSAEWNIDKTRIASYGSSAGAGTSLWLAFHDDMADPTSDDPVLRESTRLKVVGAKETQATYDVIRWPEILGFPGQRDEKNTLQFYGVASRDELQTPEGQAICEELDFIGWMTADDPPMCLVNNNWPDGPPPGFTGGVAKGNARSHIAHHPRHAMALAEKAKSLGIECELHAEKVGIVPKNSEGLVTFLAKRLRP